MVLRRRGEAQARRCQRGGQRLEEVVEVVMREQVRPRREADGQRDAEWSLSRFATRSGQRSDLVHVCGDPTALRTLGTAERCLGRDARQRERLSGRRRKASEAVETRHGHMVAGADASDVPPQARPPTGSSGPHLGASSANSDETRTRSSASRSPASARQGASVGRHRHRESKQQACCGRLRGRDPDDDRLGRGPSMAMDD